MAADPSRWLWFKHDWPDGQPNTLPEKTRTLWVPRDRHFVQLIDQTTHYALPG